MRVSFRPLQPVGIPEAVSAWENADEHVRGKLPRVLVETPAPPALCRRIGKETSLPGYSPACPFQHLALGIQPVHFRLPNWLNANC